MSAKRKPPTRPAAPEFTMVFETFFRPGAYEQGLIRRPDPYCFNGMVGVRRYRITFEEIEESREVIGQRLLELWKKTTNHHHWTPLRKAAAELGYWFQGYGEESSLIDGKEARDGR